MLHALQIHLCPLINIIIHTLLKYVFYFWTDSKTQFNMLKEYYEIVDEARPLSGFFPTHADFLTEMHF